MSPETPTLLAARWRKEAAAFLIELAGYLAQGDPLVGPPGESEATNPYGLVVAIIAPDGVLISSHGVTFAADVARIRLALHDTFDPVSAERRMAWEADIQAKLDAYAARPFPCEMGGHCSDRFETARGRTTHYAAARRRGSRDYRHEGPGYELPTPRPPSLGLVRA